MHSKNVLICKNLYQHSTKQRIEKCKLKNFHTVGMKYAFVLYCKCAFVLNVEQYWKNEQSQMSWVGEVKDLL